MTRPDPATVDALLRDVERAAPHLEWLMSSSDVRRVIEVVVDVQQATPTAGEYQQGYQAGLRAARDAVHALASAITRSISGTPTERLATFRAVDAIEALTPTAGDAVDAGATRSAR